MPDYIYYKMKRYLKDRVFKQQKHKSGFAEFKNKQKEEELGLGGLTTLQKKNLEIKGRAANPYKFKP
jgi:hypothetical protein